MSQTDAPPEGKTPEAPEPNEGEKPAAESTDEGKKFDADYVKKLRDEAAANRKAKQELEARLTEYEDRDKSELEKLTGKLTKAEQAKAEADAKLLRYEVAADKEVPAEAVNFLQGTTREELEASADKLLELVKSRNESTTTPDFDGGAREPAPEPKSPEQAHSDFLLQLLGVPSST